MIEPSAKKRQLQCFHFSVDKEIIIYHFKHVKIPAQNKHFQRSKARFTVTPIGLNDANAKL